MYALEIRVSDFWKRHFYNAMLVIVLLLSFMFLLAYKRRALVNYFDQAITNKNSLCVQEQLCSKYPFFLPENFSYYIHIIIPHIDASMLYTCLN